MSEIDLAGYGAARRQQGTAHHPVGTAEARNGIAPRSPCNERPCHAQRTADGAKTSCHPPTAGFLPHRLFRHPAFRRALVRCGRATAAAVILASLWSMPQGSFANNYSESLGWQFRTTADQVYQAAVLDMVQKRRSGFYAAPTYVTNIARQANCTVAATATGNSSSQGAAANSPSTTGAGSTASGNASSSDLDDGGTRAAIDTSQGNSGTVSSAVNGNTTVTAHGSAQQALNATQTNGGDQMASIHSSNACAFGPVN